MPTEYCLSACSTSVSPLNELPTYMTSSSRDPARSRDGAGWAGPGPRNATVGWRGSLLATNWLTPAVSPRYAVNADTLCSRRVSHVPCRSASKRESIRIAHTSHESQYCAVMCVTDNAYQPQHTNRNQSINQSADFYGGPSGATTARTTSWTMSGYNCLNYNQC